MKLKSILLATLASTVSSLAMASLSVADLSAPGDGLLTVDSQSGLAWLDLTQTLGLSVDQASGGSWIAQGFRFASSVELNSLVSHGFDGDFVDMLGGLPVSPELSAYTGGATTVLSGAIGGDSPRGDGLVPLETVKVTRGGMALQFDWGDALLQFPDDAGRVVLQDADSHDAFTLALIELVKYRQNEFPPLSHPVWRQSLLQGIQVSNPEAGVFLVKDVAVVPEPDAMLLMGIGLVGVFAVARRANR